MVSERPLPDRCGAKVVDNVGLELTLEGDVTVTDEELPSDWIVDADEAPGGFDAVLLTDGDHQIEGEPTYSTIREHLWNDCDPVAIAVVGEIDPCNGVEEREFEGDTIDADMVVGVPGSSAEHTWYDISSVYDGVTNRTSDLKGFCERYPMNGENTCYVHQGGGAPEGNVNGLKHGLYAQRTGYYENLDDNEKEFIEALVDSWLSRAPYERDSVGMVNELYRAAIDQHRAWRALDSYMEDGEFEGFTKEVEQESESGEVFEMEIENPKNIPYSRLTNDVRMLLKDHGIYSDPETKKAEATESLAKKLSGMGSDS